MSLQPNLARRSVPVIGLLGGIASGKSFVGRELEKLGCARIDADRLGHEVLQTKAIEQSLHVLFGPGIFGPTGDIDRSKLAELVFGKDAESNQKRKQLESVVHPAIHQLAMDQIQKLREAVPPPRAIVVDAPLLIEAGWTEFCDYIFFIDTPDEIRQRRLLDRGWTVEQWKAREAAQVSLEVKRKAATHFIPGDESTEWLRRRLLVLLDEMHTVGPQSSNSFPCV